MTPKPINLKRALVLGLWQNSIQHTAQIHYGQIRPMKNVLHYAPIVKARGVDAARKVFLDDLAAGKPMTADCSEWATLMCLLAGFKDPNGLGYNGTGNTETMSSHLPHYTNPKTANIGALAIFGFGAALQFQHVATVIKPGPDPDLGSHGQEAGPLSVKWSVEVAVHPHGEPIFLNVSELLR